MRPNVHWYVFTVLVIVVSMHQCTYILKTITGIDHMHPIDVSMAAIIICS